MKSPKEILKTGVRLLEPFLNSKGFIFIHRDSAKGSGGNYAWGEFCKDDKRIELHFRYSLGLVSYHYNNYTASHTAYMKELGAVDKSQYPGSVSDDPLDGFKHLLNDLKLYTNEFLTGDAKIFIKAASAEAKHLAEKKKERMADSDFNTLKEAKSLFRGGQYKKVIELFENIKYPELMTQADNKMFEIARRKK